MKPTLHDGDWLVIDKFVYINQEPRVDDVIVLKEPDAEDGVKPVYLVKRIVGVPGDKIDIRAGKMYINDMLKHEGYTDISIENGDFGPIKIPDGKYFVMGDNRHLNRSKDSRFFGTVDRTLIMGRVDWIVYPFNQMRSFH